jgi:hypothetical protein
MSVPNITEKSGLSFGTHPGGQGNIHLSFVADPTQSNIVYLGGDRQFIRIHEIDAEIYAFKLRQPGCNEKAANANVCPRWPNSLGARDFTGTKFLPIFPKEFANFTFSSRRTFI